MFHSLSSQFLSLLSQLQTLIMKRGAVSPLYLHLACEDLRNFASFDKVVLFVHSLGGLIFSLLGFYNFQNNATIATIRNNTNTKSENILFLKPDCLSPQYVDMRIVPVVHTNLEIPPLLFSWRKTSRVFLSLWASWWSTAWTDCAHSTGVCWGFAGPWQRSLSAPLVGNDETPWGLQLETRCVKSDLLLIDRAEGGTLVLCAQHVQWPDVPGWKGVVAGSTSIVLEAQRTDSNDRIHSHCPQSEEVGICEVIWSEAVWRFCVSYFSHCVLQSDWSISLPQQWWHADHKQPRGAESLWKLSAFIRNGQKQSSPCPGR